MTVDRVMKATIPAFMLMGNIAFAVSAADSASAQAIIHGGCCRSHRNLISDRHITPQRQNIIINNKFQIRNTSSSTNEQKQRQKNDQDQKQLQKADQDQKQRQKIDHEKFGVSSSSSAAGGGGGGGGGGGAGGADDERAFKKTNDTGADNE
ncbi:hypothetical protein NE236_25525 [Actinoallomurus purpureus]|uniref:hypothetical protein n=1 Tax=Actinoallomurus purpureus TaxID=478114 RepID=UPI0020928956|nr:hypothetical protein [Actinoallomurus purpureus]MCO6008343.1 hypothetical protein [Actinoallomurus purpureus]